MAETFAFRTEIEIAANRKLGSQFFTDATADGKDPGPGPLRKTREAG